MAKAKHVPLRRCVVCRCQRPQGELLRLYRDASGHWQLDVTRKAGGRGAWLCRDSEACHKVKTLGRFFRADAPGVAQQLNDLGLAQAGEAPGASPAGGMNVR